MECDKRRYAAVCGEYCIACKSWIEGDCRGCAYELGAPPRGECALFQCAQVVHGLEHCGLCANFPCETFLASSDPPRVQLRMAALRRRREIGTLAWLAAMERADATAETSASQDAAQ